MRKGILHAGAAALAAAMMVMGREVPAFAARPTPTFARVPEYDGLGRKIKPKAHPRHGAKHRTREWQDYANRVVATHRVLADGAWQEDPRDDKYLHSHARAYRGMRAVLAERAA